MPIKTIIQTAKAPPPEYVVDMIMKISPGWEYIFFNDSDIIDFFNSNPHNEFPDIASVFWSFENGAHRADLFRYYYLYLYGGVYLDTDAMVYVNLDTIVQDFDFVSVKSVKSCSIFQGILYSNPKNKFIYEALKDAYRIDPIRLRKNYHILTYNLHFIIKNTNRVGCEFRYKLYQEQKGGLDYVSTMDSSNNVIAKHYYKYKVIPLE